MVPETDLPTHRERLLPGLGWWVVLFALVAMLSVAYGAALGRVVGVVVAVVAGALAVAGLWWGSPVVEVSTEGLRCGGALLPAAAIGGARIVDTSELLAIRRGLDSQVPATAYSVMPTWSPRSGVVVSVTDEDPHGVWIVGTRDPVRLATALRDVSAR